MKPLHPLVKGFLYLVALPLVVLLAPLGKAWLLLFLVILPIAEYAAFRRAVMAVRVFLVLWWGIVPLALFAGALASHQPLAVGGFVLSARIGLLFLIGAYSAQTIEARDLITLVETFRAPQYLAISLALTFRAVTAIRNRIVASWASAVTKGFFRGNPAKRVGGAVRTSAAILFIIHADAIETADAMTEKGYSPNRRIATPPPARFSAIDWTVLLAAVATLVLLAL